MSKSSKHIKDGSVLAEALSLPVAEGRFHADGVFYKCPTAYPCAFFDRKGYQVVASESILKQIAKVGIKVNMRHGISLHRGYIFDESWRDWPEIEKAHAARKSAERKWANLTLNLNDEEKRQLFE